MPFPSRFLFLLVAGFLGIAAPAPALDIQFDYTYDTGNFFFNHNDRKALLDTAAAVFETRLTDTLTAITPGGSNSWHADFFSPVDGSTVSVSNLTIATGVVKVYVGARQLGGSTLGEGGPGGWGASGSQAWFNTLTARGQTGALAATPTDFGPWGGSLAFDIDSDWYFGTGSLTGKNDFLSVATHELGHLLGLGTADSWDSLVSASGTTFTGTRAKAAHGGIQVSLSGDQAHWAEGTMSTVFGTATAQEAAMDPSITTGTQKFFTTLDFAGMQDIGWTVAAAVPEPSTITLLVAVTVMAAGVRRRERSRTR
jgi:hypothetical protein